MDEYNRFFKYVNFFILYVFSFYLMDLKTLEWLGIIFGIIIYIVSSIFLFVDLINSPKNNDSIVTFFIIIILLIFISCILIASLLIKIRKPTDKYMEWNTKDVDRFTRGELTKWKQMFIACIILTGFLVFVYFTLDVKQSGEPFPFFNFEWRYAAFTVLYICILIVLISLSIYMVHAGVTLNYPEHAKPVYDEKKDIRNDELKFPTRDRNSIGLNSINDSFLVTIFSNLNLDFFSKYSVDMLLDR
jgi:hypothetical protein